MAAVLAIVMPFEGQDDINFALDLATRNAIRELRKNRWLPKLYQSGVRWKRDKCTAVMRGIPGACEPFKSPLQTYKDREGDCDDVTPWRTAEIILGGDRRARARAIPSPGIGWHVVVVRGDGTIEDPSKRLGMVQEMRRLAERSRRRKKKVRGW